MKTFGPPADIWSFGILIFSLITGSQPTPKGESKITVAEARSNFESKDTITILNGAHKNILEADCKDFLDQCL